MTSSSVSLVTALRFLSRNVAPAVPIQGASFEPLAPHANRAWLASMKMHGPSAFSVDQVTVVVHRLWPAGIEHGDGDAEIDPDGSGSGTVTVTEPEGTHTVEPSRLKQTLRL